MNQRFKGSGVAVALTGFIALAGSVFGQERASSAAAIGVRGEAISGVRLTEVSGEAAAAGLMVGDVVASVDGTEVSTQEALEAELGKARAKGRAVLSIRRGAKSLDVAVVFGAAGAARGGGGYLGLRPDVVNGELRVGDVLRPSPASVAGIVAGDVVLTVDGTTTRTAADLGGELAKRSPGDLVALSVRRAGAVHDLHVVLGRTQARSAGIETKPRAAGGVKIPGKSGGPRGINESVGSGAYLGAQVEVIGSMVKIAQVAAGSPAQQAAMKVDDTILQFDGTTVQSEADIEGVLGAHGAGDRVRARLERNGDVVEVVVSLAASGSSTSQNYL